MYVYWIININVKYIILNIFWKKDVFFIIYFDLLLFFV